MVQYTVDAFALSETHDDVFFSKCLFVKVINHIYWWRELRKSLVKSSGSQMVTAKSGQHRTGQSQPLQQEHVVFPFVLLLAECCFGKRVFELVMLAVKQQPHVPWIATQTLKPDFPSWKVKSICWQQKGEGRWILLRRQLRVALWWLEACWVWAHWAKPPLGWPTYLRSWGPYRPRNVYENQGLPRHFVREIQVIVWKGCCYSCYPKCSVDHGGNTCLGNTGPSNSSSSTQSFLVGTSMATWWMGFPKAGNCSEWWLQIKPRLRPHYLEMSGAALTNHGTTAGRRWATCSSWRAPRSLAGSPSAPIGIWRDRCTDSCGRNKGEEKKKIRTGISRLRMRHHFVSNHYAGGNTALKWKHHMFASSEPLAAAPSGGVVFCVNTMLEAGATRFVATYKPHMGYSHRDPYTYHDQLTWVKGIPRGSLGPADVRDGQENNGWHRRTTIGEDAENYAREKEDDDDDDWEEGKDDEEADDDDDERNDAWWWARWLVMMMMMFWKPGGSEGAMFVDSCLRDRCCSMGRAYSAGWRAMRREDSWTCKRVTDNALTQLNFISGSLQFEHEKFWHDNFVVFFLLSLFPQVLVCSRKDGFTGQSRGLWKVGRTIVWAQGWRLDHQCVWEFG